MALILIYVLVLRPPARLGAYWIEVGTSVLLLVLTLKMVRWEITGIWLKDTTILACPVILSVGWYRRNSDPGRFNRSRSGILTTSLKIAGVGTVLCLLVSIYSSGSKTTESVELTFPLREVAWVIAQGGNSLWVNHHVTSKAQYAALDIVAVDRWGRRAAGLLPSRLASYASYGVKVYAPCAGTVSSVESSLPDLRPPSADRDHPEGNAVVLFCGDNRVLLAHLRQNSIKVDVGEQVAVRDPIGEVGNSGNTSEPHLHLHAVQGCVTDRAHLLWTGTPVAMRLENRKLSRGDSNWSLWQSMP